MPSLTAPDPPKPVSRWLIGILALALSITLFNLGRVPLFDEDEGEYAEVAVEMAHSGDFITPTLNGQPFFEKPILAFWLQAPLVQRFGVHEWVFRLPSAVACLLWVVLLIRFGRRFMDAEAGWAAGLFCATSIGVIISGEAAAMDGVLSLLIAAAGFDIFRAWASDDRHAQWRVFLWMALGFLAKGPVALVVPVLISFIFYAMQGSLGRWFRAAFNPLGWIIFLAVASPWYLAQYHLMGQPFLDYFLYRENLGRLTGSLQGHGGNLFYYVPVLLLLVLPHTSLLLRAGYESLRQRSDALTQFLLIWFVVVFGLFTFASTKLPHYLLIGLTPVFLLMARYRERLRSSLLTLLPLGLMGVLALVLPTLVAQAADHNKNPYLHEMLSRGPEVFAASYWMGMALVSGAVVLGLWLMHLRSRERLSWQLLALAGIASNLLVWMVLIPAAADLQQEPLQEAAQVARSLAQPTVADNRMPSFAVYSGRSTENRTPHSGDLVFLRADRETELPAHETLFSKGGVRLVRMTGD
ncbi:MAG: glycosyltransferase family 39 protein [Betaproteobacteria bacterium]|nr:glycosyltransferase family 39 protein [Betaproteobacteria bacterium]